MGSWAKAITPSKSLNGPWLVMGWHKATLYHKLHLLRKSCCSSRKQRCHLARWHFLKPAITGQKKKTPNSPQTDGAYRNGSYMGTTKSIAAMTNTLLSALSQLSRTSLVGGKDRPKFRCFLSQEKGILFFKFIAPQTVWKRLESQRPTERCLSLSIKTAKNKLQGLTVLETGHLQRDVNVTVPPSHGLRTWKAETTRWLKARSQCQEEYKVWEYKKWGGGRICERKTKVCLSQHIHCTTWK